ncbi:MAG: large conductance mechanosensitive channel protein MscL, partial [Planctomycetes bacterium HGW-Planctomycetes-1]
GVFLGGVDFKNLQVILKEAVVSETGETLPAVALRYGQFINTLIDFFIVALTMFVVIKLMSKILRARQAKQSA